MGFFHHMRGFALSGSHKRRLRAGNGWLVRDELYVTQSAQGGWVADGGAPLSSASRQVYAAVDVHRGWGDWWVVGGGRWDYK